MAAYVKFVKPEHVEILNEYLAEEGVALIFPEAAKKAKKKGMTDGQLVDYDFGGEADLFVEVVRESDHYFLRHDISTGACRSVRTHDVRVVLQPYTGAFHGICRRSLRG